MRASDDQARAQVETCNIVIPVQKRTEEVFVIGSEVLLKFHRDSFSVSSMAHDSERAVSVA